MPSTLPDGEPVPDDGALPAAALDELRAAGAAGAPFGVYVHVPFCATRCGYCDFNTYTATELGPGVGRETYAAQVVEELRLARRVLGDTELPVATVFFGGGTPTLLPAGDLADVLRRIDDLFGLAAGAEVTTEANPDSVTAHSLGQLRAAGFTRVSVGMQSAVPHVLATLERTHRPENVAAAVRAARDAGFDQVSLDLIYGTAGESARGLAGLARRGARAGAGPPVRVRAGGRGRHAAGGSGAPGRGRGAGRRRPGGQVRPGGRDARGRWTDLVRGEQLGPRRRRVVPAQPRLLARATTGGGRGPARTATSAASAGGTSSTRPPTRSGSRCGDRPRTRGRSSTRSSARPSGRCSACAWSRDCRSRRRRRPRRRRQARRGRPRRGGRAPTRGGCA